MVNCVNFRIGEKQVLRYLDQAATQFIQILEAKSECDDEFKFEPIVVDEKC